jgi:hypothetical protein
MDEPNPKLSRLLREAQSLIGRLAVIQRQIEACIRQDSRARIPPNFSGIEGDFVPPPRVRRPSRSGKSRAGRS